MTNRLIHTFLSITISSFLLAGCSEDNDSFLKGGSSASNNSGVISQKNISLLADDPQPKVYDATKGTVTDTTVIITAKIGDKNNQLITGAHTIFFATEWGLIEPSCTTKDGICTVEWQTSFGPGTVPAAHQVTITGYALGEEHFSDSNGNGIFDDNDTPFPDGSGNLFTDREEPFVDANRDGIFNSIDVIIDVIDGNSLGKNGVHDFGDGFLNSPNCTHSSLCSTTRQTIYVWDDIELNMDGPPTP
jgi:hypothetical protein